MLEDIRRNSDKKLQHLYNQKVSGFGKKTKTQSGQDQTVFSYWSGRRDSNSRQPPWQGGALPTELLPQYL